MSLAKVIASAFIVHGTHFSVLKQIHPSDVYDFHITALDYIARKILGFVKQEKSTKSKDSKARAMKKRFQALSFFRVLLLLLGPVTGKDALRIKSHLEEAITSTEAPISVNKSWDAYRVYEKRLLMIASKDPNVKTASKRVAAEAEDEDGSPAPALAKKSVRQPVLEHAVEEEEEDDDDEASPAPTATTRTKVRQPAAAAAEAEEEDGEEELGIGEDDSLSPAPTTPAKRPLVIDDEPIFEPMADVDMNVEMDFDLDLSLAGSQESRARSVSIEPTAKKRRTVKRF